MNILQSINVDVLAQGPFSCNAIVVWNSDNKKALIFDAGGDVAIKSFVEQNKLKVEKLIHTHAHLDHISTSNELSKLWDAPIVMHKESVEMYQGIEDQANMFMLKVPPPGKADETFSDGDSVRLDDLEFKVLHTPGHSPGSSCFYTEQLGTPLLISGDTLFRSSIGRTDLPGGDYNQIISSLKNKLAPLPKETRVIPGHGPETTIGYEVDHNPYLR